MATKKHLCLRLSHPCLSEAIFCDSPSILKVQILAWHSLCNCLCFRNHCFQGIPLLNELALYRKSVLNVGRWAKWDANKLVNAWPSSGLKPLSLHCVLEDRSTQPTRLDGLICCAEAQVFRLLQHLCKLNKEDLLLWRCYGDSLQWHPMEHKLPTSEVYLTVITNDYRHA